MEFLVIFMLFCLGCSNNNNNNNVGVKKPVFKTEGLASTYVGDGTINGTHYRVFNNCFGNSTQVINVTLDSLEELHYKNDSLTTYIKQLNEIQSNNMRQLNMISNYLRAISLEGNQ